MAAPTKTYLSSQLHIKMKGKELAPAVASNLLHVEVEQHSYLPAIFTLRLRDPDLRLLDDDVFKLGETIDIEAETAVANPDSDRKHEVIPLIHGEIAALEPDFGEYMVAELVVRGYDKSYRLYRKRQSRTFVNQKDSDIAAQIAKEYSLKSNIKATSTVYEHLFQHNQCDLHFLRERAWRIGYECFVRHDTLYFRPPPQGATAVATTWGDDLLSFYPRLTMAEQVTEVTVRGWDVDRQKPIVGRAQAKQGQLYPHVAEKVQDWLSQVGADSLTVTNQPVITQAEADLLAKARLNEQSGTFIQAEGTAFRRPDIEAGQFVHIQGLGERLSGRYLVTTATHVYAPDGLTTHFTVRGARNGTFAEQIGSQRPLTRQLGIVPAIVTNTDDPNDWGRVKVKYAWLTEEHESGWARVMGCGVGPAAGFFGLPDVGDEVWVAFEQGDFNFPLVLGGTWNGQHKLPPAAKSAPSGQKPLVRTWTSREGHQITLYDTDKKLEIKSAGGLHITLDDNGKNILIEADNEVQLKARGNMTLEAGANMDLKASGNVTIKGATINLN